MQSISRVQHTDSLPNNLKTGIEKLSGFSMEDVKVNYNSDKPAQLKALAFAQGAEIHLAPGQEEHLPHEAWHVVQQKQQRVNAAAQLKGAVQVNDDPGLENEADSMGSKALNLGKQAGIKENGSIISATPANTVTQRLITYKKRGKWSSRQQLIDAIAAFFNADPKQIQRITEAVIDDEGSKDPEWIADNYYRDFIQYAMEKFGWAPPFVKKESKDSHGPQLPVDTSIKKPMVSASHSSENTFTFPNKTMGRAQVIHNGEVIFDTIKYSDTGVHAEAQMIMFIDSFVKSSKYKWADLKIRITINNFPCDEKRATCGKKISEWATARKMQEIHIYYANKYEGSSNGFLNSWKHMKNCNIPINLTPFSAEEYLENKEFGVRANLKLRPEVPEGEDPDPFSDSEDEEDEFSYSDEYDESSEEDVMDLVELDVIGEQGMEKVLVESVKDFFEAK